MIISRTFPRSASVNRSRPNNSSIAPNLCIPSRIGVFLLGLTHPMSQFLFWDTERIRLSLFPQQSGHGRPTGLSSMARKKRSKSSSFPELPVVTLEELGLSELNIDVTKLPL